MDERATVECMDRNIENPYDASYKPLQRLTLSEIGRKTQLAVTLAGLRDPVSHETALAIWGVELPERCWRPRLGESAMDWRSPPRYREFDPDPEYVEYMRRAQLADHPDFGRSYEDAADSGSPAGTSRRRARKDAQESTRRGTQGAARRNARDVRGKAHPTENVAWESNSAACSPIAAFPNVSLHTVVRAPCLRRKARGVAEHVWKGLRDEHIHEIAGIPVLMPIPAWSLMGGSLEIWELAEVAESLIRHDYATRESLLRFVDLENIPYRGKCLDALELVQPGSDSPKETELRLALVRYGLPIMRPNCVIPDVRFANGTAVTLDLVDHAHRFGLDYQGDHHRTDKSQWRRDQTKLSRLTAAGWTVLPVTQLDLSDELHRAALAMNVAYSLSRIDGNPVAVTTPLSWHEVVLVHRRARKSGLLE